MIVARTLQGFGGAIRGLANFSLIDTLLPEGDPRRRALSVFGVMQGLSLVIGLLAGEALTTQFDWRFVFLLILAGVGGVVVLLNLYMQIALKMTAMQAGLGMTPYAATVMVSGQALTPMMARLPHRVMFSGGFGFFFVGLALLALVNIQRYYWMAVAMGSVVIGFGTTAAFMLLSGKATSEIPLLQQGAAMAALLTSQVIGVPLGAAIALSPIGLAGPAAGLAAFRRAYLVIATLVLLAVLIGLATLRPAPALSRALA